MKFRVRANNGFKSEVMTRNKAHKYAMQLRLLGNYGVEVVGE